MINWPEASAVSQAAPLFDNAIWTVSDLNRAVSDCLEANFPPLWVKGEIRGLTMAASGHWYFTLKDERSEVSCAMFAGANRRVNFRPKTGDHVQVRARVSIYAPRGSYQLVVDAMHHEGLGELYARYLELKAKLQTEGLFDADRKVAIPSISFNIAVVTSLKAAALRDVIRTLNNNAPYAAITVFPASVQGEAAPEEIKSALKRADASNADVILLVRGGGSLQDLWAFNDEGLARTIASLQTPVISGVGHESDETIADYVADLRCATPTAAAEHATEKLELLLGEIAYHDERLMDAWARIYQSCAQHVDALSGALVNPREKLRSEAIQYANARALLDETFASGLQEARQNVSELRQAQEAAIHDQLFQARQHLTFLRESLMSPASKVTEGARRVTLLSAAMTQSMRSRYASSLQALTATQTLLMEVSPEAILKKGYTLVTDSDGRLIKSAQEAMGEMEVTVRWSDGAVSAQPLGFLKESQKRLKAKS